MWATHKNTLNVFKCPLLSKIFLETVQLPLKHQFYKFGNMLRFSRFNVIVSNPFIFLPIFNFTLTTCRSFVACHLESHAISIKCCFGMWQSHVRCFLKSQAWFGIWIRMSLWLPRNNSQNHTFLFFSDFIINLKNLDNHPASLPINGVYLSNTNS